MPTNLDLEENLEQDNSEITEIEKNPEPWRGLDFNLYSPFRVDLQTTDPLDWDKFLKKINTLPVSIKNTLTDADTVEFIIMISEDFDLSDEQSSNLSRIVRDILLADEFLGDFPRLISSKLGVDMNIANQVANKIASELFAPAIEDIKNMQREKFKDRIAQAKSNQAQQPPPNIEQGNVINLRDR